MKQTMKQVIRYQCEYCKKEFRTPDRHQCKFRPELRNCFTCKHFIRWSQDEGGYYRFADENMYPECPYGEEWNICEIQNVKYNMQCKFWEAKYEKVGKCTRTSSGKTATTKASPADGC